MNAVNAAPSADSSQEDRPAPRSYFERAQASAASSAVVTEETTSSTISDAPAAPVASLAAVAESAVQAPVEANVAASVAAPAAARESAAPVNGSEAVTAPAVLATPSGLPPVARYTLQIDSLHQVAQGSGLIWVNSDADKVAAVQAAIAAEPKPVRVPRERPPAVVLNEGPLVLVETRKDLKDMNLPF
jgi:ribonuclease E